MSRTTSFSRRMAAIAAIVLFFSGIFLAVFYQVRDAYTLWSRCQSGFAKEIAKDFADYENGRLTMHVANDPRKIAVRMTFNLAVPSGQHLFLVSSERAGGFIYAGPYQREIRVEIAEKVYQNGGRDNVIFILYRGESGSMCAWNHTEQKGKAGLQVVRNNVMWGRGFDTHIDLLPLPIFQSALGKTPYLVSLIPTATNATTGL